MLQLIYTYYAQNLKWTLENQNLSSSWNTTLIFFLKCKNLVEFYAFVYEQKFQKYKSLVMHMMLDKHAFKTIAKANLELLCDSETFMGLTCALPLLKCMQSLSKFVKNHDILILLL